MFRITFVSFGENRRRSLAALAVSVLALCCMAAGSTHASDETAAGNEKEQQEQRSKRRLEIMKSAIGDFNVSLKADASESPVKFASNPLLRYNDETRGFLDAAVWRLGEKG